MEEMKKESTSHPSHWTGFSPNSKVWTDEEISDQVEIFLKTPSMNQTDFKDKIDKILTDLNSTQNLPRSDFKYSHLMRCLRNSFAD